VAVISGYALVRAGLTQLVQTAGDRVVVVDTGEHDGHLGHADVVLYDLAGLTSDENVDDLRHLLSGGVPVVGLARDGRTDLGEGARTLGVRTILAESVSAAELVGHLERAAGRVPSRRSAHRYDSATVLTERERDVLRLIAVGMSNQEIADELVVSVNSVKTYARAAYKKIGVTSRSGAILWAIHYNLVPRPG
jgi:DNA-binding NarL/FixJ family response regulator